MHTELAQAIFELGTQIRYVAFGEGQQVSLLQRSELQDASDPSSDRFEELLVNPTLLAITKQRGELDCGGLRYLVVAYGNFSQLVIPTSRGHASIALEIDIEPEPVAAAISDLLHRYGLVESPTDGA